METKSEFSQNLAFKEIIDFFRFLAEEENMKLVQEPNFWKKIKKYIKAGCPEIKMNSNAIVNRLASKILGDDYIDPKKIEMLAGVTYNDEQLVCLYNTLPDLNTLIGLESKYILMPTLPSKIKIKWLIVQKELVAESFNESWDEQKQLIKGNEYIPSVSELLWVLLIYQKLHGRYLFDNNRWIRALDESTNEVKNIFLKDGEICCEKSNNKPFENIGIASARKITSIKQ